MYRKEEGVQQDYETAVKWWRRAAEQGYADAQFNLGAMYDFGTGVLKDYVYAHMWYNIAAISGKSMKASKSRDLLAKEMTPSQLEKAQDLARDCVRKKYKEC
jgi:TPR repeat protein